MFCPSTCSRNVQHIPEFLLSFEPQTYWYGQDLKRHQLSNYDWNIVRGCDVPKISSQNKAAGSSREITRQVMDPWSKWYIQTSLDCPIDPVQVLGRWLMVIFILFQKKGLKEPLWNVSFELCFTFKASLMVSPQRNCNWSATRMSTKPPFAAAVCRNVSPK